MIYPDNREVYFKNAEEYARRINDIDQQFRHPYYEFGPKTVAVADVFPFAYMLKEYNVDFVSATDGCNKQTKLGDTSKFIAEAKGKNVTAVFKTELSSNNDFAAKTAAELGVPVYEINTVHSISKEDFENGVTFIDIAQKNLENFLKLYK
jgi:zinc transport system substrate-binding protein